jgi:four helix bundle protein
MGSRRSHKDLIAWQKAMDLASAVLSSTATFPRCEAFGLAPQMRRAAVSVASNIAEGTARRTTKEFVAFLHFARGSLAELETQVLLSSRAGFLAHDVDSQIQASIEEVGRLINGLLRGLRARESRMLTRSDEQRSAGTPHGAARSAATNS